MPKRTLNSIASEEKLKVKDLFKIVISFAVLVSITFVTMKILGPIKPMTCEERLRDPLYDVQTAHIQGHPLYVDPCDSIINSK